jgi:MoxR-like ATPase
MSDSARLRTALTTLQENLARVIRGKRTQIDMLTLAVAAGGSVLMEDVPGVGKTTLAKALAKSIDLDFRRVQFTPDLLPGDILGSSVYSPVDGTFTFRPGPIFCNVLLADEINRASPRTQSALLEAMGEGQATIEGITHPMGHPFIVLATENPVEYHGTYPLPEAQLDRFLMQIDLGYPDTNDEIDMLFDQSDLHPLDVLAPVLHRDEVVALQAAVRQVTVGRAVAEYMVAIARQSREETRLQLGISPRAVLMLYRASQASAFAAGRDYVLPDDVQRLAPYVLAHRVILTPKSKYAGIRKWDVILDMVRVVPVPV